MNILVTGANGQVGSEIQNLVHQYPDFQFFFTDLNTLDISQPKAINDFFQQQTFHYCINCAAYTAVDKAETDQEKAGLINSKAVKFLAEACQAHQTTLIHLSTDYVYHTDTNKPYVETDTARPKSVYAITKYFGEQEALKADQSIVIRTSWVYSSYGHNFVKTMLRLAQSRDRLSVVFDQIGTPTYAHDLADTILKMIKKTSKVNDFSTFKGIYHYSNEGVTSWFDFAKAIFDLENINIQLSPIESKDYPTPAPRPHFSVLNKAKVKATFDLTIPHWHDSLKNCLKRLKA